MEEYDTPTNPGGDQPVLPGMTGDDATITYNPTRIRQLGDEAETQVSRRTFARESLLANADRLAKWTTSFKALGDDPRRPAEPGSSPNSFVLHHVVGQGGMGEVWEATQVSLGRMVAVKRLRDDLYQARLMTGEADSLDVSFRQEAFATAVLDHPNIVPVHDLGLDEEGRPLLAMKLVRGRPWSEEIKEDHDNQEISVNQFISKHLPILMSVTQAVAFAHSRGIVHRDLKPSQVMLGEFGEVLLMDWGIALIYDEKRFRDSGAATSFDVLPTRETAVAPAGTPVLMAPEQTLDHSEKISPATDVYLLGGTLYQLLTGRFPRSGFGAELCFRMAQVGQFRDIKDSAGEREMPEGLMKIALQALAEKQEERTASAKDFLTQLRDWTSGATQQREAGEIVRKVRNRLALGVGDYQAYAECLSRLAQAHALHADNPDIRPLRAQTLADYVRLALANDDLVLARAQFERMEDSKTRDAVQEELEKAEVKLKVQMRTRRLTTAIALIGLVAIAITTVIFNFRLAAERNAYDEARRDEESAKERIQELLEQTEAEREVTRARAASSQSLLLYAIRNLGGRLDPDEPSDRELMDQVAEETSLLFARQDIPLNPPERARSIARELQDAAETLVRMRQYDDAAVLLERSLKTRRALKDDSRELAALSARIGEICLKAEDPRRALSHLRMALLVTESAYGEESPEVKAIRENIAIARDMSQDTDSAPADDMAVVSGDDEDREASPSLSPELLSRLRISSDMAELMALHARRSAAKGDTKAEREAWRNVAESVGETLELVELEDVYDSLMLEYYAEALIELGRAEEAMPVLDRISALGYDNDRLFQRALETGWMPPLQDEEE